MVINEPRSAPYFVEVTNRPVCAAKERDHQSMAQPPRLLKELKIRLNGINDFHLPDFSGSSFHECDFSGTIYHLRG
jgi:hypothetical protein